jgi:hypothetical protein
VMFNGLTLAGTGLGAGVAGGGKNFIASGAGPDGRGALVNDYGTGDANRQVNSLSMIGDLTIGGTNSLDIGSSGGTLNVDQFLDGGGNTLTKTGPSRFVVRGTMSNLPTFNAVRGTSYIEGVDNTATTNNVSGRRT